MATIADTGMIALAKQVNGVDTIPPFTYIALDSSSTAESAAHTGPQTEITTNGGARAAATCTIESNKTVWTKTFTFTGSLAINAVCILNAASVGILLCRHLWPATKNVVDTDTLEVILKMDNQRPA